VSDAGDSTLYLLYDANYNVTAAVKILVVGEDYVPTVVERYHHTPYGLRTVLNADWTIDTDDPDNDGNYSDYNQTLAHQGGSIDFESGVIKFRHRDLHVSLGLWLERDPLGYVDGGSLYEYVRSRPGLSVDPLGLRSATTQPTTHPTSPRPSKQKDDAGAECCEGEMTVIELKVRQPAQSPLLGAVQAILDGMSPREDENFDTGHVFLDLGHGETYGFWQRPHPDPGGDIFRPDPGDGGETHSAPFKLCPESLKKLRDAILKDMHNIDNLCYQALDRIKGDDNYQCASWATERLQDIGIDVPLLSDPYTAPEQIPGMKPVTKRRT
jgi:RHS repeat-associated protein